MGKPNEQIEFIRVPRQLGVSINRFRKLNKLSQKELAAETGLRQAGISLLESGAKGVRLDSLFRVLAALDLEIIIKKRTKEET